MIQNKKRIISLILMLTLLVSALVVGAVTASAADTSITVTGASGSLASDSGSISWTGGDFSVVNYKNTSSTAIRTSDSDHFRLYVGNKFTISGGAMSKVVITCTGTSYLTNQSENTVNDGWTASASGTIVTYTATSGSSSELTITIGKQSRVKSVVITPATSSEPEVPTCEHANTEAVGEAKDATCTEAGITAGVKCSDCGEIITAQEEIPALGHNYVDGACSVCGAEEPNETVFDFGANGNASHVDGNDYGTSKEYVVGDYTLSLKEMSKVFGPAYDAKGNSCIKLGTSSVAGKFSFTVYNNVQSVIINVAGYKTSAANISVNGGNVQNITTLSNNGEYTAIEVDTSTNKTVSFTTANGGYRAMINSIVFVFGESNCEHDYAGEETKAPTCTETGVKTYTCSKCGDVYTEDIATIAHSYDEGVETTPATCTSTGVKTYTCTSANCGNSYTEDIDMIPHTYTDGKCVCGKIDPLSVDYSGAYFIAALRNESYWYMTNDLGEASNKRYQAVDSGLTSLPEAVCTHDHVFVLERNDNGTYCISTVVDETVKYITWTSGNTGTLTDDKEEALKLDVIKQEDGTYIISFDSYVNNGNTITGYLSLNDDYKQNYNYFAFYKDEIKNLSLVTVGHNHEACPHTALIGNEGYATIQDAIADAEAGSEIVLRSDIEIVGDLTIENQVTINLNGKTLTAGAVVTFYEGTQFIGEGKLEVAKNSLYNIKGETDYVPVWNEAGYYTFSEVVDQVKKSTVEDTEVVVFRPAFENTEIKNEFADGAADNGISFVVSITWEGLEKPKEYTLSNTLIAEIYSQKKAIQLGFENWQAGVEYTVTLRVVSGGIYYETTLCTMKDGAITVPEIVTE